jgi:hypothetical protein
MKKKIKEELMIEIEREMGEMIEKGEIVVRR